MNLETHNPVPSVFLLVANLATGGDAAPVRLLAPLLLRNNIRVTIGVVGTASESDLDEVRAAYITVRRFPIRHFFDVKGVRRLRQALREIDPTVVHAWGPAAASVARHIVSGNWDGTNTPRLVVSGASITGGGIGGWLIARQIRRADRVIPTTRVDGERYRKFGVSSERLTLIGPATSTVKGEPNRDELCKSFGIPSSSQFLIGGGRSYRGIGPKDAIVAFDMLRYDNPQLHLIVFGSGPETVALEQFGRALAFDDFRIRFATSPSERAGAVQMASAVLITQSRGGVEVALEAMAIGKPVVGWNTPELMEIVDDGVTGFLVPVGDRVALASKARKLLEEPDLAVQMGEAGKARIVGRFSISRMFDQYKRLYMELAGGNP
ncbi:MAG TPA: glycosyltransferase family 4 protein [Gemmata sp.]|nr:glycosyltransferase family 4 protein [Gemmata sp.]